MLKEEYVQTIEVDGYIVNVGLDDYGQSYFFEFVDEDGTLHTGSCGTYNAEFEDEIRSYVKLVKRERKKKNGFKG